jgi:hypothetical protein
MSVYTVECSACGAATSVQRSPKDFPALKRDGAPCAACGLMASYVFQPGGLRVNFAGPSWSDKNMREKDYRLKRSETLARRQKDNHWTPTLQPNFQGERTDTWREAQHLASSQGAALPETYEPLVQAESRPKT